LVVKDDYTAESFLLLYINAFNTTLLNNKAQNYQKQFSYVELQGINKNIFVDGNGLETVLWSK
jgi:hypothetical protein